MHPLRSLHPSARLSGEQDLPGGVSGLHTRLLLTVQVSESQWQALSCRCGHGAVREVGQESWGDEVPSLLEIDREGRPLHLQPHVPQGDRPHPLRQR
jgi:hypothetical protein